MELGGVTVSVWVRFPTEAPEPCTTGTSRTLPHGGVVVTSSMPSPVFSPEDGLLLSRPGFQSWLGLSGQQPHPGAMQEPTQSPLTRTQDAPSALITGGISGVSG